MILCSNCGEDLKQGAKFCGKCGSAAPFATGAATPRVWPGQHGASAAQGQPATNAPAPKTPSSDRAVPHSLADVYSSLRSGAIDEAAANVSDWWKALRWEIRLAIVAAALAIPVLLFISAAGNDLTTPGGFMLSLILLPVLLGALIALARPHPVPGWMARFAGWSAMKRDRGREKGTFLAKWFFRPFYGALCGSNSITASIHEPHLRGGVTLALQFFALYIALFVAYAGIMIVMGIAIILFVFWIISLMLSEGFSSGCRTYSGRSETSETLFGRKYTQHLDSGGNKSGYTEQRTGLFGDQYQQHFSQDGKKAGRSEGREGLFGNQYQQHYETDGSKAGYSESKEGLFGNRYVQNYDQDGEKTGRSEARENLFGRKYVAHEDEGN